MDCFELAKVLQNDEVMSYLSKYKVCYGCTWLGGCML